MGYTTDFSGSFDITPPLTQEQVAYLNAFARTRRMTRDSDLTETRPDPVRTAVGLPVGDDGGYFVGEEGFMGQTGGVDVIRDSPPIGQPALWMQWVPSEDGTEYQWDEGEKFYNYVDWLVYAIEHFFKLWGCRLDGSVQWVGEEHTDQGEIEVTNNKVVVRRGILEYGEPEEVN